MDFLAMFSVQDASPEQIRIYLQLLGARAHTSGLDRLLDGDTPLPIWVRDSSAWITVPDPEGGINVCARQQRCNDASFRGLCSAPRTGPVFHVGRNNTGSIACDHIGISPIYWLTVSQHVVVGSRSSYLLEKSDRRLNLEAVYHYLNFSAVPTPFSILQGVHRLAPGHILAIGAELQQEVFWDLRYADRTLPATDASPQVLRQEIRDAVRRTASGLNPSNAGAFLSGGTDSTTVAAFTAEILGGELDVYSIVFEDQAYSEESFMRAAAQRFPLRRNSFCLDQQAFLNALAPIRESYDEPYANASVYAAYYCFKMAHEAGKQCLLAGDGGDEIFAGNERYLKDRLLSFYAGVPSWCKVLWERPLESLPLQNHTLNRLRNIFRRARMPNPDRFFADTEFASAHWNRLQGPAYRDLPVEQEMSLNLIRDIDRNCSSSDALHRLLYLDMKLAIADNDLLKITRCGALFDIEPRFPFLDLALVEYVNHLPSSLKMRGTQKRYLFKEAMKGYLPDHILFKRKQGMGLPLGRWLREDGPVAHYAQERLADKAAENLFDRHYLKSIWNKHQDGLWDHGEDLWRIVVLIDWCTIHGSSA